MTQFGGWVWGVLHGDLGISIFTNLPVTQLIGQRVEPTLALTLCTLLVSVDLRDPAGRHRSVEGRHLDRPRGHGLSRCSAFRSRSSCSPIS